MLAWWEIVIRILLSMFIGGIVGVQREFQRTAAGFRTHTLVALGACVAMLTNEYLFRMYAPMSNMDIARMGSYVISGIGFLGAGSIIKDGFRIQGLTTAAGLWVVACLGIAAGAGFYIAALAGTFMVVLTLTLLKVIEDKFMRKKKRTQIDIQIKNAPGQLGKVLGAIGCMGMSIRDVHMEDSEEKWLDVSIMTTLPNGSGIAGINEKLDDIKGVRVISINFT